MGQLELDTTRIEVVTQQRTVTTYELAVNGLDLGNILELVSLPEDETSELTEVSRRPADASELKEVLQATKMLLHLSEEDQKLLKNKDPEVAAKIARRKAMFENWEGIGPYSTLFIAVGGLALKGQEIADGYGIGMMAFGGLGYTAAYYFGRKEGKMAADVAREKTKEKVTKIQSQQEKLQQVQQVAQEQLNAAENTE